MLGGERLYHLEREGVRGVEIGAILQGESFSLTRWSCCESGKTRSPEKLHPSHAIVFVLNGSFRQYDPHGVGIADPTRAVFYNAGQTYETSHPVGVGDRGCALTFTEEFARKLVSEIAPGWESRPKCDLFPATFTTIPGDLLRQVRELLSAAERAPVRGSVARLRLEEQVAEIAARSMATLREQRGGSARPDGPPSRARERSLAIQEWLLAAPEARWELEKLSARLGVSLHRMCREFRSVTGISIHRYLLRLRTAKALDEIQSRPSSRLLDLALDLGFDSHSHFSATFQRLRATTPSRYRGRVRALPRQEASRKELGRSPEEARRR